MRYDRAATTGVVTGIGAFGGARGGALLDGAIGTAICPGVGTVVGGVICGVAGGVAGAYAGSEAAEFVNDQWDGGGPRGRRPGGVGQPENVSVSPTSDSPSPSRAHVRRGLAPSGVCAVSAA